MATNWKHSHSYLQIAMKEEKNLGCIDRLGNHIQFLKVILAEKL